LEKETFKFKNYFLIEKIIVYDSNKSKSKEVKVKKDKSNLRSN